ncbi:GGDEF domain-containing protein [Blautia sp. MSJ-9]|uniref:GGDEF domain-containing protein n=1 Tax=Blautia sp. MSJ-9 TaxID=2841511 RepID=UPI001C11A58F|nr:GGDEF domain-containing protein [Blautia sp. MSJ-9]MBU5678990.1 GGDEF domain-containing protein [Blautia sp. MSJ-9]
MKEETLAQFMRKDRNKYLDWFLKILGVIVIIGIIVMCLYGPVNYNGFSIEKCQKMENIFEVSWGNKKIDTALSCMIENPDLDTISVKTVLHKSELGEGDSILFRSRQSGAKVYLDDELVYDSGDPFDYPFLLGYGSFWRSVKLGDDYDGKTLTIELKPEYEMQVVSGYVPNIFWGTQPALMLMILKNVSVYLVLTVFLIVLGCVMMLYGLPLLRKKRSSQFFFLALFSIDTGLWMLIETHILEMFVRNIPVVIYLSYFTYGMMPVLLVRFLLSYEEFKKKIYLQLLYLGGIFLNIFQLFWSMTGICSEFESQGLNRIYLGLTVVGLLVLLLSVRNAEKEERKLYSGIFILVLSTVLEFGYFLLIDKKNSGRILIIGICLFVINSGISLIREVRAMQRSDIERAVLVKMAYTDGMTQLGNRFAYDQEKSRLESLENVRIIILIADMNGLKKANDSYGHSYGDQIICKTAEILQDSFQNLGKCFRLGGDEFCVLAENVERTVFETGVRHMEEKTATLQANIEGYGISFGIAEGVSRDIEDIYHIADNLMYSKKRTIKR